MITSDKIYSELKPILGDQARQHLTRFQIDRIADQCFHLLYARLVVMNRNHIYDELEITDEPYTRTRR